MAEGSVNRIMAELERKIEGVLHDLDNKQSHLILSGWWTMESSFTPRSAGFRGVFQG